MHHSLRMGKKQEPIGLHIFHAVAVDPIRLPQQMNRKLAIAIWVRHRRNASLQEVLYHAEIPPRHA